MNEKARSQILKYLRYVLDSANSLQYSTQNPNVLKSEAIDYLRGSQKIYEATLEREFQKLVDEGVMKELPSIGRPKNLYRIHREHYIWKE